MTQYPTPVNRPLPTAPQAATSWPDSAPYRFAATRSRARWLEQRPAPRRREKSVADVAAAAVRRANARDCLTILLEATTPLTVGELAIRSGLSRPTVDAVLQGLIEAGPVRASQPPECHSPGRPARRFVADPMSALVAGVGVAPGSIRCLVTDAAGRIVARTRTSLDPAASQDRLDAVAAAITAAVAAACADDDQPEDDQPEDRPASRLAMVGLAVPAILDHDHRVARSVRLPEWTGVDLGAELSQRLGCPVAVENDLRLAALAEHHIGGTAENMIFVQLGRRISVAMMVGGRILHGSHRMAGELGAQRGLCWTTTYDQGGLNWSTGREAKPLFDRAAAGDRRAIDEIEDFCGQIAPRLATLILTLDPQTVIVGGGLSLAGETLLGPLRRHLDHLVALPERPDLVPASLRVEAAETGALGHAFEQGSEQIFGIAAMPAPWQRLRGRAGKDPRSQARISGAQ